MVTSVDGASLETFTCYAYNVQYVPLLCYDAAGYVFSYILKARLKSSDNIPQVLEDAGGVEEISTSSVVQILQQSFDNFGCISNGAGEWVEISINNGERLTEQTVYKI
jgi:hypothetical protein